MTTENERTDALPWVVHIEGPDDVLSFATKAEARQCADDTNELVTRMIADDPSPFWPRVVATVYTRKQWDAASGVSQ